MKLMIVDDHAGMRDLIRRLVAMRGDTVLECPSGAEALNAIDDFKPDCVTMDVHMAGANGIEVTRTLHERYPQVRIVIVTTHDQSDLRTAAAEAGAKGYVTKDYLFTLRAVLLSDPQVEELIKLKSSPPPELDGTCAVD